MSVPDPQPAKTAGLFETMRLWRRRVRFADLHRARMEASAAALSLPFDAARWARALREATARAPCGGALLRVQLDADGAVTWTTRPLAPLAVPVRLVVAESVRADANSPLLPHKTTERELYDEAFAEALRRGADDALIVSTAGRVTETSRFTVFYRLGGRWHTPPVSDGLLPGILRGLLVARRRVGVRSLPASEVAAVEAWSVGNSARGCLPACLVVEDTSGRPHTP